MLEYKRDDSERSTEAIPLSVKVVGIGGAGANVLDRIALEGMDGAELISMNTDIRGLSTSVANSKIQLGRTLTQGLAAGGDPELGQQAAAEAEAEIRAALQNSGMVFICAGLGGGTGSGAAPYIAKIAREEGAFVVAFVTVPFSFEGRRRLAQASESLRQLEIYANALVTFDNDRMGDLVLPKEGIQQAFTAADQIISQSVRAVTSLVTQPGLIRIGMDDLLTALRNHNSRCLFGFGQAKGENRAQEALARALKSPLLDKGQLLKHAGNAIVQVTGGDNMTLYEVEILMNEVGKYVRDSAQILFGVSADAKLSDSITVTVISSVQEAELKPLPEGVERPSAAAAASAVPPPAGGGAPPAAATAKKPEAPAQDEPERAPVASNLLSPPAAKPAQAAVEPPPPEVGEEVPVEATPLPEQDPDVDASDASQLDVFVDGDDDESPFVEELELETAGDAPSYGEEVFVDPNEEVEPVELVIAGDEEEDLEDLEVSEVSVFVDAEPDESPVPTAGPAPQWAPDPPVEVEPRPEVKPKGGLSKLASRLRGKPKESQPDAPSAAPRVSHEPLPELEQTAPVELPAAKLPPRRRPVDEESPADHEPEVAPPEAVSAPRSASKAPAAGAQQDELIPKKPASRGRFEKTEPTIIDGEDLDVPAFLRKKGK